jgi:hypothetical protein
MKKWQKKMKQSAETNLKNLHSVPSSPEQKALRDAESRAFSLKLELIEARTALNDALRDADRLASHLSNVLLHDPEPAEIADAAAFLAEFILSREI